jgi:hypothetical protein
MHAPDQTIEHFEKLLPYAIALDQEKHWSDRFETLLASASEGGYHQPGIQAVLSGLLLLVH